MGDSPRANHGRTVVVPSRRLTHRQNGSRAPVSLVMACCITHGTRQSPPTHAPLPSPPCENAGSARHGLGIPRLCYDPRGLWLWDKTFFIRNLDMLHQKFSQCLRLSVMIKTPPNSVLPITESRPYVFFLTYGARNTMICKCYGIWQTKPSKNNTLLFIWKDDIKKWASFLFKIMDQITGSCSWLDSFHLKQTVKTIMHRFLESYQDFVWKYQTVYWLHVTESTVWCKVKNVSAKSHSLLQMKRLI